MTPTEKCEQHRSCQESKWSSTEQLGLWEEGQEDKRSTWSKYVRRVEWPKICWLGGARSTGLYWKLFHLIAHWPWAVISLLFFEKFFAVYAEYKSWTTRKNTLALLLVYSVKRATWAPSLYVSWFPFKGEHGGYIVIAPRIGMWCPLYCHACCNQMSHSLRELGAYVH